jgi:hypothetical protein
MKRFVMAVALACALSVTALAGIVPTSDYVPPPPPPPESTAVAGIIPTTDYAPPPPQSESLVETMMLAILGIVVG